MKVMMSNQLGLLGFVMIMFIGTTQVGAFAQSQAPTTQQAQPSQPTQLPPYKLVKTIPLGPDERWDYATFDSNQNRIYVAHGDRVTAVDAANDAIIGQIGPIPGGTHGIAVSLKNG